MTDGDWSEDERWEDVFHRVAQALRNKTGETFDVKAYLSTLADLLLAALSDPERRPVVELVASQWLISEGDVPVVIAAPPYPVYSVSIRRLHDEPDMQRHVAEKTWVDEHSWSTACLTAKALYPLPSGLWNADFL